MPRLWDRLVQRWLGPPKDHPPAAVGGVSIVLDRGSDADDAWSDAVPAYLRRDIGLPENDNFGLPKTIRSRIISGRPLFSL